ncbi:MAG: type-IV secretion system protein TraC [Pseudomonadota bacterium]
MSGILSSIFDAVLGDGAKAEKGRPDAGVPMLAHWLPYRSYDAKTSIFHNASAREIAVEISPMVGADERSADIIAQCLSEGVPPGATVQIVNFASSRIGTKLSDWFVPRYSAQGVYERMAKHRTDYLSAGVWHSLSKDAPFHLRHFRVIISIGIPDKVSASDEDLVAVAESIMSALRSTEVESRLIDPVNLLALIDDITSPTTAAGDDPLAYNSFDSIADQAVRRDMEVRHFPDRLELRTERLRATGVDKDGIPEIGEMYPDTFEVRSYAVRNLPPRWAPWDCARLIGDLFTDKLRLPCPVATTLCLTYPDITASANKAAYKYMRTSSLSDSKSARFLPQLKEQSHEWEGVQEQLRQGNKLVRAFYGVTSFSPKGKGDGHERTLKSMYKACGWDLHSERYMQMVGFLACLPMTLGSGLARDLERMKRMRTMLTTTAANLAPFQGEYKGGTIPHLLLVGRRGEPFFWSPFENAAGNHNVAVFGKSGSGKSVALQELCAALCGAGSNVIVIDDGRSFEHSCKLQGGAFVEFTLSSGFCINPFSMIDADAAENDEDYKLDCLAMLKAMVSQMARHIDRLNDTERGLIDGIVNAVWTQKGRGGSVDDVIAGLQVNGDGLSRSLAVSMLPFGTSGTYGKFFAGEATFKLNADLTVFELSDLSSREELRSVVLTAIMFMSSQSMRKLDRSRRKALIMDEAWQMLKGGAMAEFVETYARTCRKYGASLITATQSLNDYYKSEGSVAALENSDWFLILQQKPESISDFMKLDRFEMSPGDETLMRSLKRNGTEFSDIMIKGPETLASGRLVLDPYSATIFSSSPRVFAEIEALVNSGLPMEAAIERVAYPDDPSQWSEIEEAHASSPWAEAAE